MGERWSVAYIMHIRAASSFPTAGAQHDLVHDAARAAEECATEYCALVDGVRTEQLSGLVDLLGAGQAGTTAVLSALNTESVSASSVSAAAGLLATGEAEEAEAAEVAAGLDAVSRAAGLLGDAAC